MATSTVTYQGHLRTECVHLRSGNTFITDAPTDNNGKGEAFSPTDTVATALASCMLTIMGIRADKHGWNINGAMAQVTKHMGSGPRRIVRIEVEMTVPGSRLDASARELLEDAARNCPVAKSIHPDIDQVITFTYSD